MGQGEDLRKIEIEFSNLEAFLMKSSILASLTRVRVIFIAVTTQAFGYVDTRRHDVKNMLLSTRKVSRELHAIRALNSRR